MLSYYAADFRVITIGQNAFANCNQLVTVNCEASNPPSITETTFDRNKQSSIHLNVPINSCIQYRLHELWSQFSFFGDFNLPIGMTQGSGGFAGSGSGTEDDPYLIFNPIQLYNVRNFTGRKGIVFKLMADIDLSSFLAENNYIQGWEPIGTQDSPFLGVFHGEGHTIKGLFINRPSTNFVGLFGFAESSSFDNLSLECNEIIGGDYSGSLVGFIQFSNITNVISNSNVSGKINTGGLAGMAAYCIACDCHFTGALTGTSIKNGGLVGSITASEFTSCSHSGMVSGEDYTGGLAGYASYAHLQDICNDAIIIGKNFSGGVIGMSDSDCTAKDVQSNATVSGSAYIGGFAGKANQLNASRCFIEGGITTNTSTDCSSASGFIGSVNDSNAYLSLNECSYTGTILANAYNSESAIGGLVGHVANARTIILNKSSVIADLTAQGDHVGGLIGYLVCSDVQINNCFVVSDIYSQGNNVGGLVGFVPDLNSANISQISNSYYNGWLTGKENVGGIVGYGNHVTLDKNYASGYATGSRYVGGIAGYLLNGSTATSCVAAQDAINAVNGDVGRVYGFADNTCAMGTQGTNAANRGMTTMNVVSQGLQLTVEDGAQHGTAMGKGLLRYKSSYQGLNWDFTNDWTILETESYPYKPSQCAPPVFTSTPVSGDTSLSGQCAVGAKVYVRIGQEDYEAQVTGTNWTALVPAMQSGVTVKAYALTDSLIHSYYVTTAVGYPGEGTEQSPYLIYTASDLANINSYSYYKVMNDIDLTDWIANNNPESGWLPVGTNGGGTMKQLDGDGHTVTGLWLKSSSNNTGLISSMENAIIKNLQVITADGKMVQSSGDYAGILVGKSVGCAFENVMVRGQVAGNKYVGAITGYDHNSQFSTLTVDHATIAGASHVGGIAGEVSTPLDGLKVKSTIITATGDSVGGLVGSTVGSIARCQTEVTLTGKDFIGGIAGCSSAAIGQCASQGSVATTDLTNCRAGGIVGYTTGDITDCYSTADTRGGLYAGGIAGYSFGKIDNCHASGDLYATNFGGGIVGYLDGANAATNNCFAINNKIDVSDQQGVAMRVIGGFKNGAATPQTNNHALKTMVVSVNDVTQIIYDDPLEGISLNADVLMQQATYAAQGWDFDNVWGINEGEGHPYLLTLVSGDEPSGDVLLGDVNGDNKVNVSDYVTTASYILEQNPQPFIFAAADLDENGSINVTDLVGVAAIALTYPSEAPRHAPAMGIMDGDVAMNATMSGNEIVVSLDNDVDITALQIDLTLPQGMSVAEATLTDRGSDSHTVDVAQVASGNYRLLAASSVLKAFKGHEGALLRISLSGEAQDVVTLHGIQLATPATQGIGHSDILLAPLATGVHDANAKTRIYAQNGNIVVETLVDGQVIIALPNGMSVAHKVHAGRNTIAAPVSGIVLVKMNGSVAKIRL